MIEGHLKEVLKGVSRIFGRVLKCVRKVSLMDFQGSLKSVSRVFQGYFKKASRVFQESFKVVSRKMEGRFMGILSWFKRKLKGFLRDI